MNTWHVLGMRACEDNRIWISRYDFLSQDAAIDLAEARNREGQQGIRFFVIHDRELPQFGLEIPRGYERAFT